VFRKVWRVLGHLCERSTQRFLARKEFLPVRIFNFWSFARITLNVRRHLFVGGQLEPVYIPPHLVERTRLAKEAKAAQKQTETSSAVSPAAKTTNKSVANSSSDDAVTANYGSSPAQPYSSPVKADSTQTKSRTATPTKSRSATPTRGRGRPPKGVSTPEAVSKTLGDANDEDSEEPKPRRRTPSKGRVSASPARRRTTAGKQ
jgi:hypothetical protein